MAGKQTENQLLFSAVSSPFDNFTSLLVPPTTEPTQDEGQLPSKPGSDLPLSLQPHLKDPASMESNPSSTATVMPNYSMGDTISKPPMRPPIGPIIGIPSSSKSIPEWHRPNSKYVVPPEIGNSSSHTGNIQASQFTHVLPPTTSANILPSSFMIPDASQISSQQESTEHLDQPIVSSIADFSNNDQVPSSFEAMAANPPAPNHVYHPVTHHWFFYDSKQSMSSWTPFSVTDSMNIEEAYRRDMKCPVSTDGGRYDVDISKRKRIPLFWDCQPSDVRRCSWFHRGYAESLPVPYDEIDSGKLEDSYKNCMESGLWHVQVNLTGGEKVVLNSPYSMQHYHLQDAQDFPNTVSLSDSQQTPQVVRRGTDDFPIADGAADKIDHLLFLIHGIGSACDLSFRSVEECVDDFRSISEDLIATHFKEAVESGQMGRVEILPISWHKALHGDETGLDDKLKLITLRSIPKFREFTNDTLLDVLFFTSPVYCQHIMDTVSSEMERLLTIFRTRHPHFDGGISLGGHSLGSVILFDLLMHQKPSGTKSSESAEDDTVESCSKCGSKGALSSITSTSKVDFERGSAGTGHPLIHYPQLTFEPEALFLMGSPVGMFVTVRGIDTFGPEFRLPTCPKVYNIFHPFDPVAYRIETLIDPSFMDMRPVMIPHHKGRKRMHLELKDTIERVGSDIKNKIYGSLNATWDRMWQMYSGSTETYDSNPVDQAIAEEESTEGDTREAEPQSTPDVPVGCLNSGRRIDYVLQEKPYESLTEYIFALQAHLTYWQSEDTLLMILNELYNAHSIYSDSDLQKKKATTEMTHSSPLALAVSPQLAPPAAMPIMRPQVPLAMPSGQPASLVPAPPIPMSSLPPMPPAPVPPPPHQGQNIRPRILGGRPVFDPSVAPAQFGMDPTAIPTGTPGGSVPRPGPPPQIPGISFNRKT